MWSKERTNGHGPKQVGVHCGELLEERKGPFNVCLPEILMRSVSIGRCSGSTPACTLSRVVTNQ